MAVLAIHAALFYAFLHLSGRNPILVGADKITELIEVPLRDPPPPPPPPPQQRQQQQKPKEEEGGSPANIRSQATPVVAPKPQVEPQRPNPIAVTETPNQGAAPTQGAADVRGPGTGAGGTGTGTGTGSGSGPGGGGGGIAVPAALVRGISGRDYPPAIQRSWPRGGVIFLRLRIEPNGRPSQCDVMRGFGDRLADQWTCSLVMQRGLFRPARDARGNPVSAWFGYKQVDISR